MTDRYDDIINLPHPTSDKHPRMKMLDRAAQFSPFAALTGYDDSVDHAKTEYEAVMLAPNEAAEESI